MSTEDDPEEEQMQDRRDDPAFAIRSLPAAHGRARLRGLVLLGAYYAFQAAAADHRDSALFWLRAARALIALGP